MPLNNTQSPRLDNHPVATSGLSPFWTYKKVVERLVKKTGNTALEKIDIDDIRYYINAAVDAVYNMIKDLKMNYYSFNIQGTFDSFPGQWDEVNSRLDPHSDGLYYITLDFGAHAGQNVVDPYGAYSSWFGETYKRINEIERIHINSNDVNPLGWDGGSAGSAQGLKKAVDRKDLQDLIGSVKANQDSLRYDVFWANRGPHLVFYVGQGIFVGAEGGVANSSATERPRYGIGIISAVATPDTSEFPIYIWGQRKPYYDDLTNATWDTGYNQRIDLPNEYMDLMFKMVERDIYEHTGILPPSRLEDRIALQIQQIDKSLQQDMQQQQQNALKNKTGEVQQDPGVE